MRISFIFVLVALVTGCATTSDNNPKKISEQRQQVRDQLSGEISLKEDRHNLDDLRKEVPAEKKQENDELAFVLNQTAVVKDEPGKIRERFQHVVEKRRHHFNDKVEKIKKQYQRDETARRDAFVKEQSKKRDKFKSGKHPADETHDFYQQMDKDRLDFFAKEKEKRSDFDDEIRDQTKDFNDYMKSKYDEFTEQMRIYTKRYEEAKKNKTLPRGAPADPGASATGGSTPKLPEPPYDQ